MELRLPSARSDELRSSLSAEKLFIASAYALLGATLILSRLIGLNHGFWLDEAIFVEHFVREGPSEIVLGGGLSHELYGVLDWATASLSGESATAFRLWSALPFVLGVALVTAWFHRRNDPIAGVVFLFLATVSPLLLDISRQARGYGLAFLAMAVVIVAALEAKRSGRTGAVVLMCAAGVVGAWTLPQFAIGFVATAVVLFLDRRLRLRVAIGLVASVAAILVWFVPHFQQVHAASQNQAGAVQTTTTWVVTAPFDQIMLPALIWIDGATISSSLAWLPFVLLLVVVMGSSPFIRERDYAALVLLAGPVTTVVALWLESAYVAPRYLSFLLVPLLMLLASGGAAILRDISRRRATVRVVICLLGIAALALHFAFLAPDVMRLPREANRDAAELIDAKTPADTPVYGRIKDPAGLDFYLDRAVRIVPAAEVASRVCHSDRAVVYVLQPWATATPDVPCLARHGVDYYRLRQYARGGEIDIWLVPPVA
jgi:hypothetical protein